MTEKEYEVQFIQTELRVTGVLANSKEEAIEKFLNGDYGDCDGIKFLGDSITSVTKVG